MNVISQHFRADTGPATDRKRPAKIWGAVLLALAVIAVFFSKPAGAADLNLTVNTTVDSNASGSLRNAIIQCNAAAGSHTIVVPSGIYTLSSGLGPLEIKSNVTIVGAGGNPDGDASQTVIQASASAGTANMRVFDINPLLNDSGYNVSVKALTIRNGNAGAGSFYGGGGIAADTGRGTVTIYNCLVENNNSSYEGGGLSISGLAGGTFRLEKTIIRNNAADGAGGGIYIEGDLNSALSLSNLQNNTSRSSHGGGMSIQPATAAVGPVTISGSTITGNTAAGTGEGGGGIYLGTPATILGTTISGNTSDADGGGVYYANYLGTGLLTLRDNTSIENNNTVQSGKIRDLFVLSGTYVRLQPPVVTASSGATAFIIGGTPVAIDPGLTVADIDNPTLASAAITVTGNFHAGEDLLVFTNTDAAAMGNIAGSYNPATGVLTLTSAGASATLAQWQAALQTVTYANSSGSPDTSARTISFVVNDGTSYSAASAATVRIAPTASGSGTTDDPYQIKTAAELNYARYALGVYYILKNDIDLTSYLSSSGAGWVPIGSDTLPFTGSLDGGGHAITGLTINSGTLTSAGLFGRIGNAGGVKNLRLPGVSISTTAGASFAGSIAGINAGTIQYCSSSGSILGGNTGAEGGIAGGICGRNDSPGLVFACSSDAVVTGRWDAGGIAGNNYYDVKRCCFSGTVANLSGVGGVSLGGIVGYNGGGNIYNSYCTGTIAGTAGNAGGITGANAAAVHYCYAACTITVSAANSGGVIGNQAAAAVVDSCYYDSAVTGQSDTGKGTGLCAADMKKQASFSNWDFSGVWRIVENGTYPILRWQPVNAAEINGMITADLNALAIGYASGDSADSVTESLTLSISGANGTTTSWDSSDKPVIANNGAVIRPTGIDKTVTLTATVSKTGGASQTKPFTLIVKAAPVAPAITGPGGMTLAEGYSATSTEAYTITGIPAATVTKTSGNASITWNDTAKKLDIAKGLTAGSYPVILKASNGTLPDATLTFTLTVTPPATHTVSLSANPPAGGSVTGGGTYSEGARVTVTAAANSGYSFANWTEGGSPVSTDASYDFTLGTSDRTLTANFTAATTDRTVTVTSAGNGTASGGGPYDVGESVTLSAAPTAGYNFDGWYAGEAKLSSLPNYTFIVTDNITLTAKFTAMPNDTLKVTTVGSGVVKMNSDTTGLPSNYTGQQTRGADITLTATASSGNTFVYWQDGDSGSILSTDSTYRFLMGAGVSLKAVFNRNLDSTATTFTVTFKDKNGKILQFTDVPQGTATTPPASPSLPGYRFTGWDKTYDNVNSDMTISALYERLPAAYTLTVVGGTLSAGGTSSSFQYDMPVTVVAGTAPSGEKFSHWQQDGVKVSTSSSYSFYTLMQNTTLTAVFVAEDTVLVNTPLIFLSTDVQIDKTGKKIQFIASRSVPDGYTLIESGVLLLRSNAVLTDELTLDTADVVPGRIKNDSTDQFYISKSNINDGDTWYGRAYLMYRDANGNIVTVYSDNTEKRTMN